MSLVVIIEIRYCFIISVTAVEKRVTLYAKLILLNSFSFLGHYSLQSLEGLDGYITLELGELFRHILNGRAFLQISLNVCKIVSKLINLAKITAHSSMISYKTF